MENQVPKVTVVAVCLGDGPVLDGAVERVARALVGGRRDWRFVFVDDGTHDGTFARLLEAARGESRIGVLRQDRRRGFGSALRAGLARSTSPIVCAIEVDPGFCPERIEELVRRIEAGADVATTSAPGAGDAPGGSSGFACAFRPDRIDLGRRLRLPAAARLAVPEIAIRARRAGLAVHGDDGVDAVVAGRSTGIGGQLRKLGIAMMSRGARRDGVPQRAA